MVKSTVLGSSRRVRGRGLVGDDLDRYFLSESWVMIASGDQSTRPVYSYFASIFVMSEHRIIERERVREGGMNPDPKSFVVVTAYNLLQDRPTTRRTRMKGGHHI